MKAVGYKIQKYEVQKAVHTNVKSTK